MWYLILGLIIGCLGVVYFVAVDAKNFKGTPLEEFLDSSEVLWFLGPIWFVLALFAWPLLLPFAGAILFGLEIKKRKNS